MTTRFAKRRAPRLLALVATLFGGIVMGVGNNAQLWLDAQSERSAAEAHAHHGHHAHHGESEASAAPLAEPLPAHCLFCLDGIVPQPVAVTEVSLAVPANAHAWSAPHGASAFTAAPWHPAHPRAPPALPA